MNHEIFQCSEDSSLLFTAAKHFHVDITIM